MSLVALMLGSPIVVKVATAAGPPSNDIVSRCAIENNKTLNGLKAAQTELGKGGLGDFMKQLVPGAFVMPVYKVARILNKQKFDDTWISHVIIRQENTDDTGEVIVRIQAQGDSWVCESYFPSKK